MIVMPIIYHTIDMRRIFNAVLNAFLRETMSLRGNGDCSTAGIGTDVDIWARPSFETRRTRSAHAGRE